MGIISSIMRPKAMISGDIEKLIRAVYGGNQTSSGVSVNDETAIHLADVYTCILILTQSLAQLPLHLYKRDGKEVRIATEHPLYEILHDQPNEWMTDFDFKSLVMAHLCLRGNSLWLKATGSDGVLRELIPIHPDRIEGATQDQFYRIHYRIKRPGGGSVDEIPQNKIFHVRGLSTNGFWGLSPIECAREAIGLGIATEKHGAKLFSNGARLGGILKHPRKVSPTASANLRESFDSIYSGIENAHKTAILEEGITWEKISMTAEDSQFLETRKYQRSQTGGFYRVPAHLMNDLEKATFSNIELIDMSFVKHTMTPWMRAIEGAIRRDLIVTKDRSAGYYAKFNADGMLRGDVRTRYESYASGINNGVLCPNEARELEERPPYPGGEQFRVPLNMATAGDNNNEPKTTPQNK